MPNLVKSLLSAAQLYLLRRRQYDNLRLRAYFQSRYGIEVGLYSYGCFDRWRMPGPMKVGRYCSIANTVRSVDRNHPIEALTTHPALYERNFGVVDEDLPPAAPLIIEDDVWIGHNAIILPGCKYIGRGAVIGAGAIVTRDVERYAVVAGNPARKLKDRYAPDLIEALEGSRWWDMDLAALRKLLQEDPDLVLRPSPERVRAKFGAGAR